MTVAPLGPPQQWPRRLLTVAEYVELGETEVRTELVEGLLTMSAHAAPKHMRASLRLATLIDRILPPVWDVFQEVDLDLQLASADQPGFVRAPDLVVVQSSAAQRVDDDGGMLRASEALLVVEIVSPGSSRVDRKVKRGEYADAGIPHYWIVDIAEPVSLLACHLAGELGYADDGEVTGTFRTLNPFECELDLTRLV